MQRYLYFLIVLIAPTLTNGQQFQTIDNFMVKENLIKNDKLAIIATDTAGQPLESISGTYQFVINGFRQELKFNEGVAVAPNAIEQSIFVFIKHQNQNGSHGKLYYVYRNDSGINPIEINWIYLILIPAGILLIAYMFKRLMVLAIILLVLFFIFNYNKGLGFENIFETIIHGIRDVMR